MLKKKRGTPLQRGLLVKSITMGHQALTLALSLSLTLTLTLTNPNPHPITHPISHQAQRPLARRMLKVSNVPLQADKDNLKVSSK